MKNIIYKTLLLSTISLSVLSCNDELLDQRSQTAPYIGDFYNTLSDFRAGVDYAYDGFKSTGYYAQTNDLSQVIIPDIISDNLIQNPTGRLSNNSVATFDFASNVSGVTALYGAAYGVVARANAVLAYIDRLPDNADRKNIEGEARAIRALAHFDIVIRYSKIPTQTSDAGGSMGIAYVEKYDPLNTVVTRDITVNQVYDKIIADLLFAEQNINQTTAGRFTKSAVQGLLSRVYLYKGDYPNAILYGEKCLLASPNLGSLTTFKNIWTDNPTNEGVLFKILNDKNENVKIGTAYNQTTSGQIRSEYVADYALYTKYKATDIRKEAYFLTSPYGTGANQKLYNHVIKYRQANNPDGTAKPIEVVDVKVLRNAEVLLNVAEAKMRSTTPDNAGALALLNKLRAQRYTGFVNGAETGEELLNAILLERRLELAFEMDRFFTLKRLGLPIERSNYGPYSDGSGNAFSVLSLPASSHKWQLPIPQGAIELNPLIKQNPNY